MKIGRWIGLGIFLSIVGVGITAVASTQVDFNQEIKKVFIDPTMEEKTMQFEEIKTIYYNGNADTIKICPSEDKNLFQYYEGKYVSYDISYDEEAKALSISETYKPHIGFSWKDTNILYISSNLDKVEIDMNAGNVVIEDMTMLALDADVDCGNLVIKNSNFTHSTLSTNAGNMNIRDTNFNTLDAQVSTGNMTFLGDIIWSGDIKVYVGNLTLQFKNKKDYYMVNGVGEGASKITYTVSLGNSNITYARE